VKNHKNQRVKRKVYKKNMIIIKKKIEKKKMKKNEKKMNKKIVSQNKKKIIKKTKKKKKKFMKIIECGPQQFQAAVKKMINTTFKMGSTSRRKRQALNNSENM
jgi:hypothetical protein